MIETTNYGYATLTADQEKILKHSVFGKAVIDFGCGNLELSKACIKFGAKHVIGIDFREPTSRLPSEASFTHVSREYQDISVDELKSWNPEVAILSWPANNASVEHALSLLQHVPKIVYIGHNDGCSVQCGTFDFMLKLTENSPEIILEDAPNALIVYNTSQMRARERCREELHGIGLSPEQAQSVLNMTKTTSTQKSR